MKEGKQDKTAVNLSMLAYDLHHSSQIQRFRTAAAAEYTGFQQRVSLAC